MCRCCPALPCPALLCTSCCSQLCQQLGCAAAWTCATLMRWPAGNAVRLALNPHHGLLLTRGTLQFLDAYKSVTLDSMARSFGVSPEFIDSELEEFIVAGHLTAKIDKVAGVVETNRCCPLAWCCAACTCLPGVHGSSRCSKCCRPLRLSPKLTCLHCPGHLHPKQGHCLLTHHAARAGARAAYLCCMQPCCRQCVLCSAAEAARWCRADAKNAQYQATIKQGDMLLNRLQRLAKIIDVE